MEIKINYTVTTLKELKGLKLIMEANNIKPNFARLARELNCDYRTVKAHYNNQVSYKRNKKSKYDKYYKLISELLDENNKQIFTTLKNLFRYIETTTNEKLNYNTFKSWFAKQKELSIKFKKKNSSKTTRFETSKAKQVQIDFKEDIKFELSNGEIIEFNLFVVLLGYSRFKYVAITFAKTREVILSELTKAFMMFKGVPKELIFDNCKPLMDSARTLSSNGIINKEFTTYAADFGLTLKPCVAHRPQTKGKVEVYMKVLDEILVYNGLLSFKQLLSKISEIVDRSNSTFHQGSRAIPSLLLKQERLEFNPLPKKSIINYYLVKREARKVDKTAMISYDSNLYSLPSSFRFSKVEIEVYSSKLLIYYKGKLIRVHDITNNKLHIHKDDSYVGGNTRLTNLEQLERVYN